MIVFLVVRIVAVYVVVAAAAAAVDDADIDLNDRDHNVYDFGCRPDSLRFVEARNRAVQVPHSSHVNCRSDAALHPLHVTRHTSLFTHTSRVTLHTSQVTRHTGQRAPTPRSSSCS